MNYLTEIKLFYDWLETHELSPTAIALWHGLMHIANRSGWNFPIRISYPIIEIRTGITKSTVKRERKKLEKAGLLVMEFGRGRTRSSYRLISLSAHFAVQIGLQSEPQVVPQPQKEAVAVQIEPQIEPQSQNDKAKNSVEVQFAAHSEPQVDPLLIYKLNYTESNNKESELDSPKTKTTKPKTTPQPPSINTDQILDTIESPWRELLFGWLEYKRVQKSSYKSEIGIRKCLKMLQNLSNNNPQIAEQIIDQSIANNWAGLFPLRNGVMPRGQPPAGRRIGQVKQPDTQEKRQELLDKLKPK